jgi:hypothetical protein
LLWIIRLSLWLHPCEYTERTDPMVEITTYMDYREYLRDFFEQKKRELRFYSYRLFRSGPGSSRRISSSL